MLIIPEGISFRFNAVLSGVKLDSVSTLSVKLRKPGTGGTLTLTGVVDSADDGTYHADATPAQLVGVGDWSAWGVATWADGRVVKSSGLLFRVVAEGTAVVGACT